MSLPEPGSDALLPTEAHNVIAANLEPQEERNPMTSYMPITKIFITALAAGITWLALQVGLDLGPAEINEAAAAIVGIVAGYLVPDSRVKAS